MSSTIQYLFFYFITAVFLQLSAHASFAQNSLTYTGLLYKGKNIYVQNPLRPSDTLFCTIEVRVNGKQLMGYIHQPAYEIDLSFLRLDDSFTISIIQADGCKSKILNGGGCHFPIGASFKSLVLTNDSIRWKAKAVGKGQYFIEHFENNSWIKKDSAIQDQDSLYSRAISYHSGINKYRIKYIQDDGVVNYSSYAEFNSPLSPLKLSPDILNKKILFSRYSAYEVLNAYGAIIKKGTGNSINTDALKEGIYYINANNKTFKVILKTNRTRIKRGR
ncbi:MAG: hypothetical protein ACJ75J_08260 [Cytophagaceae bacterium]